MGESSVDLKHGLDNMRKNLILIGDHNIQYPCPKCLSKHYTALQAYAEESMGITKDSELREFLSKVADFAVAKRRQLGDVLAD